MIATYASGEYPKIGDVILDANGDEFTVYAFAGVTLRASSTQVRVNYNSDPAIYSLVRRKSGTLGKSAGSTSPSDDVAAGGSPL